MTSGKNGGRCVGCWHGEPGAPHLTTVPTSQGACVAPQRRQDKTLVLLPKPMELQPLSQDSPVSGTPAILLT